MKTLTGSLAALAIVAAREGQWDDMARLLMQAVKSPDCSDFLTCQLSDNLEASTFVEMCANPCESVSSTGSSLADSVLALSAALETNASKEKQNELYGKDEFHSVSLGDPEDEDEDDSDDDLLLDEDELDEVEFDGEDEESNDDGEFESSSSGLRLRLL